jgi:hypothetical protein
MSLVFVSIFETISLFKMVLAAVDLLSGESNAPFIQLEWHYLRDMGVVLSRRSECITHSLSMPRGPQPKTATF